MVELRVPVLGESVSEATVGEWSHSVGEHVNKDETVVALETDKVSIEVAAPQSGMLSEILVQEGETVEIGALLAKIDESASGTTVVEKKPVKSQPKTSTQPEKTVASSPGDQTVAPSVRRITEEAGVDVQLIRGTGTKGRVTKADALKYVEETRSKPAKIEPQPRRAISDDSRVERVRMTRLRQTIATRLKDAQNTAAILTTFNDVDMSNVMSLRSEYKEIFHQKHDVKLGFMGFFVKATVAALQEIPAVNAEIDGTDIIYRRYCNISVAVGTDKGLVTPVVRDADQMSIAEIEKSIGALGQKARDGKLAMDDLQGGTFTISNGGVYGSLMSTPIINPPQSGVLGMHRIEDRPVVVNKEIVIRPMMYLALSYDHRIVDGKDAVTFLVRVKEAIEDPKRLLLEV